MKNKNLLILFFLILTQVLLIGQEVEELKFIREEKIETPNSPPIHSLLDHKGNFVTQLHSYYSDNGRKVDFKIDAVDFSFEQFLFATVNTQVNRLYTFGKNPLPSDCGGGPCPVRGFRIYDLKGNLIKADSTFYNKIYGQGYTISDSGNLYIIGESSKSDSLLLKKYNLNGILQWEQNLPIPKKAYQKISVQISTNETLAIYESSFASLDGSSVYIFNRKSGQLIWQRKLSRRSIVILFNGNDLVFIDVFYISHFSIKKNSTTIIKIPIQFKFITSDPSGNFFSGVTYTDSKTEIPFVLFKKINDEYVLFKKVDLSKYNFTKDSYNNISPFSIVSIDPDGEVSFSNSNKKLIFN